MIFNFHNPASRSVRNETYPPSHLQSEQVNYFFTSRCLNLALYLSHTDTSLCARNSNARDCVLTQASHGDLDWSLLSGSRPVNQVAPKASDYIYKTDGVFTMSYIFFISSWPGRLISRLTKPMCTLITQNRKKHETFIVPVIRLPHPPHGMFIWPRQRETSRSSLWHVLSCIRFNKIIDKNQPREKEEIHCHNAVFDCLSKLLFLLLLVFLINFLFFFACDV